MEQYNNKTIHNKGFSIIELIVAISLFVIVISISVSIFLRTLRTQKTALLLIEANNNLSLTIEGMLREMQDGFDFIGPSSNFGDYIKFSSISGGQIEYGVSNGAIIKTLNGSSQPITSDAITITKFNIKLIKPIGSPARVVINITISPNSDDLENYTDTIQTTVSSRNIQ